MNQTPLAQSQVPDLRALYRRGGPAGAGNGMGALADTWNCHTLLMTQKAFPLGATVETDNEVKITRPGARRVYSTSTAVPAQELRTTGVGTNSSSRRDRDPDTRWRVAGIRGLEERDGGVVTYARRVWLQCCIFMIEGGGVMHVDEKRIRRVLRGLVLRHRKSQRGQVKTGKQCLTLAEGNRCRSKFGGNRSAKACRYCRTVETHLLNASGVKGPPGIRRLRLRVDSVKNRIQSFRNTR